VSQNQEEETARGRFHVFSAVQQFFRNRGRNTKCTDLLNRGFCHPLTKHYQIWQTLQLKLKGQSTALLGVRDGASTPTRWPSAWEPAQGRAPRAAPSADPALCLPRQGLFGALWEVCCSGSLLTMSYLQASTTGCLQCLQLGRRGLKRRNQICRTPILPPAQGSARVSVSVEDNLFFMRSRFHVRTPGTASSR